MSTSSAEQPASDNTIAQPPVVARTTSSVEQPASKSTAARLLSAIPYEAILLIARFVGAHNLETMWECSECNPYWYDWYCHACQRNHQNLQWTPSKHFGLCGQSCGCCRAEVGAGFGECEACEDMRDLKATTSRMREVLRFYDGQ